jgi:hypothetical protein
VSYHKAKRLADIVVPESSFGVPEAESSTYDDWLADFHGEFHALEPATHYSERLAPEPVPECYAEPQKLAKNLLKQQSNGIFYPSVRKKGGRCLACFRPALVYRPRRDKRYEISFRWECNRYRQDVHEVPFNGR